MNYCGAITGNTTVYAKDGSGRAEREGDWVSCGKPARFLNGDYGKSHVWQASAKHLCAEHYDYWVAHGASWRYPE